VRRVKLAAVGLAIGALVVLLTPDGRRAVLGATLRLELKVQSDPVSRERTRSELLALGHPAIDPMLAELAADEIASALGPDSAVVIARWKQIVDTVKWNAAAAREELERRHDHGETFHYEIEQVLLDQPELKLGTRSIVLMTGFPRSAAGKAFWKRDSEREILLLRRTGDFSPDMELVLAVPVDTDRGPEVIAAVKARLAARLTGK
jgi:hypothetical protein